MLHHVITVLSQKRHNLSNYGQLDCYFKTLETFSALLVLCEGNPPVRWPLKDQLRANEVFSLICGSTNGSANNRNAGDLRRHRAYNDVIVIYSVKIIVRGTGVRYRLGYLVRFKSDPLAAFSFRAQRCAWNEKAARGSDLNRTTWLLC